MSKRLVCLVVAVSWLLLGACGDSGSNPAPDQPQNPIDGGGGDKNVPTTDLTNPLDGVIGATIPSPTPPANSGDPWDASNGQPDGHNATPGTAWPVGVIMESGNDPYVQVITGNDGVAFFVFEAGSDLTTFRLNLNAELPTPPPATSLKSVHLHNGDGGKFGTMVTPSTYDFTSSKAALAWPVTPGSTYVLEIVTTGSGFV